MNSKVEFDLSDMEWLDCVICGGDDFTELVSNDRYDMGTQTQGCNNCGLVQMRPRPTEEWLQIFYVDDYRQYYQSYKDPDESYIRTYNKRDRLRYTVKKLAEIVSLTDRAAVLDYGCAEGMLFSVLSERYTDLIFYGVESNNRFAGYAEERTGSKVFSSLDELEASSVLGFDLIVVNHVLEHTVDPVLTLQRLRKMLNPNGALFVDVPDAERYKNILDFHIAHLFHFTKDSLAKVLYKARYSVITMKQHKPPSHPESILAVAHFSERMKASGYMKTNNAVNRSWDLCRKIQRSSWAYLKLYRIRNWPSVKNLRLMIRRRN